MGYRIAVDTGGTFSDVVLSDDSGGFSLNKAPTTPDRIFEGISRALGYVAEERALTLGELLADTDVLIYATTRSTNAILTNGTARTALITTEGFGDTLVFREGGKLRPFDFRDSYPEPYIPKRLTYEVAERVNSEGEVVIALEEDDIRRVLAKLREQKVEAVAVSLLWSILNPAHEQLIGKLLESELPGVPFTLSHELNPIIREYRRTSSAAIDASLKPLMQRHLNDMDQDLRAAGFKGELLVVTSFGGVMRLDDVAARPLYSVNSGPAMAPVAGKVVADPVQDIVICDTGGTSFDVSVVRDGRVSFTRETWLGDVFTGHITGLSSVDVKNIGAGGGSIAWIDSGGLLRVGPQSAGAEPGPVCYGRGGTEPTVTDAAVTLGYIDPDYFLGGKIKLDAPASRAAIARVVAEPLGLSIEEAAWAVLAVANERMVTAVRDITINQGIDPRDSMLVAGGGAGGMTMGKIAQELGCTRVIVPRTASALSASGGLFGDVLSEFTVSRRTDTGDFDYDGINEALGSLKSQMGEFFDRMGIAEEDRHTEFAVEARYPYQVWELDVPLAQGSFDGEPDIRAMEEAFHEVHERVFAVKEPGQRIECLYWKGRAMVRLPKPTLAVAQSRNGGPPAKPSGRRATWWGTSDPQQVDTYLGDSMFPGDRVQGPAIVELPTTTIVVYPEWSCEVTDSGAFMLEHGSAQG
jgi:N-methylhydantoinase A